MPASRALARSRRCTGFVAYQVAPLEKGPDVYDVPNRMWIAPRRRGFVTTRRLRTWIDESQGRLRGHPVAAECIRSGLEPGAETTHTHEESSHADENSSSRKRGSRHADGAVSRRAAAGVSRQ